MPSAETCAVWLRAKRELWPGLSVVRGSAWDNFGAYIDSHARDDTALYGGVFAYLHLVSSLP